MVSGSLSGKLISRMTKNSTWYLYGLLSKEPLCDVDPMALIGKGITIEGFYLTEWLDGKNSFLYILNIIRRVKSLLKSFLTTDINWEFELKDYKKALECYESNMAKGKVILKPNLSEESIKSKM